MFNTTKLGLAAILLTSTLLLSACQEDPEQAANALFISATQTVEAAGKVTGRSESDLTQRVTLTEEALAAFDKIVADYPQSSVAVKIVSERKVGNVDLTLLEADLAGMKAELGCFTDQAKCIALEIKKKFDGVEFDDPDESSYIASQLATIYGMADMPSEFETELANVLDPKQRASALIAAGRLDDALNEIEDIGDDNALTAAVLAYRYLEAGQVEQSTKITKAVIDVIEPSPDKPYDFSWQVLAEVLTKTGQKEKALELFSAILTAGENSEDYMKLGAVADGLIKMAEAGYSEEVKKNAHRLRSVYEASDRKDMAMRARISCAYKQMGDATSSEEFLDLIRDGAQRTNADISARWAVRWLLNCDINEPFVVTLAEKIMANPSAFGAVTESESHVIIFQISWNLGERAAAIESLIEAIRTHSVDPEDEYENFNILSQATYILREMKGLN